MKFTLGLCLLSFTVASAFAQTQGETVRVATRLIKPFVIEEKGNLTGFSIELWSEIARQINVKTEYIVKPTVRELLAGIDAQDAELGIAAISITAERELKWDFSQPMFEAGLQILVSAQAMESSLLGNLVAGIFTWDFLLMIGLVIALIAIPAHIIWFLERRPSGNLLTHRSYIPGIFEAAWWTGATLGAQADQMPRSALARLVALIWMFTSIVLIAYFTASVTSNLTLQQLRGDIKGPEDLPGKKVASVKGSTSVEYLRQHNAEVIEFTRSKKLIRPSTRAK